MVSKSPDDFNELKLTIYVKVLQYSLSRGRVSLFPRNIFFYKYLNIKNVIKIQDLEVSTYLKHNRNEFKKCLGILKSGKECGFIKGASFL